MKEILPQAKLFTSVAPISDYKNSCNYHLSIYVVKLFYKDNVLLFNTLTRQMLSLTNTEYENIQYDIALQKKLVEKYFLVQDNFNEKVFCSQILNFAQLIDVRSAITNFTIFTTTECNARCFYCFENNLKKFSMSDNVAYDVADYIIKKSSSKKVKIRWFGGEPLYNSKVINIISKKLKNKDVEFSSKMITNGYLLDEETIKVAKKEWNLDLVQITLDGTREVYNKIKNYIYENETSAFDRVLLNIETALKNDLRVLIRLNLGANNKENLFELTKYLCERFGEYNKLLSIYAVMLFEDSATIEKRRTTEERHQLTEYLLFITNYINECGLGLKNKPSAYISTNMCWADADDNITILPDGKIGKCDHFADDKMIGDIYNDITDNEMVTLWKKRRNEVSLCSTCSLYPQCIKLENCLELGKFDCDIIEQKRLLSVLYQQMRNAYDKYIQNQ